MSVIDGWKIGMLRFYHSFMFWNFEAYRMNKIIYFRIFEKWDSVFFVWIEVFFYLIGLLFFFSLKDWKLLPELNYNKRWGIWIWHCVGLNVLLAIKRVFFLGGVGGGVIYLYDWWWEANCILCMHAQVYLFLLYDILFDNIKAET